ncbi:MAG: hypothetical protein EB131_03610 [Betaproteobacteria bacterium]|nr:hypothetical protein [Betaproteobacteria bacterium]
MNAADQNVHLAAEALNATIKPFPASEKVYVEGSRPDIRVPFRKVSQSATHTRDGDVANPDIHVYDVSGPYTDPAQSCDLNRGLAALRAHWIEERGDTELLTGPSSAYGRERLDDPETASLRFDHIRAPRRAKAGANVTQMHYARRGIITPEMEFIATSRWPGRA